MISPDLPASLVIKADSLPISRKTKGQKALAAALEIAINNRTTAEAAKEIGVAQAYVAQGLVVAKYAKDLVPSVLDGSMPLQAAYRQAAARKEAQETAGVPTAQELRDRGIDEHNRRAWSQMRPR